MTTTCEDFVARLSEPGSREDPAVRAHLEACPSCRQAAATVAALERTAASPAPETLAHFATRVRAAHLREQDRASRRAPLRTGLFAGLSAVGAAAAVGLVLQLAFPAPGPAPVQTAEVALSAEPPGDLDLLDEGGADLAEEGFQDLFANADDELFDDLDT